MKEQESKVTKMVREAIIGAAEKGEDLTQKVFRITQDAVKISLNKAEVTKEKVEKTSRDAMDGVIQGANEIKVSATELTKRSKGFI